MAIVNQDQITAFKNAALKGGYDPAEVEAFTGMASAAQAAKQTTKTNDLQKYIDAVNNGMEIGSVPAEYRADVYAKANKAASGYNPDTDPVLQRQLYLNKQEGSYDPSKDPTLQRELYLKKANTEPGYDPTSDPSLGTPSGRVQNQPLRNPTTLPSTPSEALNQSNKMSKMPSNPADAIPSQGIKHSVLDSIGNAGLGVLKGIFSSPARLGKSLGNAAGMTANSSDFQKTQDQALTVSDKYTKKAIELSKAGKREEANQMFQLAKDTLSGATSAANARMGEADLGKEDALKGGVGTAAFFVPGGSGIKAGIASGALAGGLAGYGSSKKGNELSSTLGGTVTGGVIGGAVPLMGKILGKFNANKAIQEGVKDVSGLSEDIINPQVKASPFYVSDKARLMNTAKEIGIKTGDTSAPALSKLESAFKNSDVQIKSALAEAPPLSQDTLVDKLAAQLDNTDFTAGDATYEKLLKTQLGKLEKLGPDVAPADIYALKTDLGNELSPVFKKIEAGNPLTKNEEVRAATYYALKDTLDTVSPEISRLNGQQHDMYTLSNGLVKSLAKNGTLKVPVPFTGIKVPFGTMSTQRVSSMGQQAKNGLGGISNAIKTAATGAYSQPILRNTALIDTVTGLNGSSDLVPQPQEDTQQNTTNPQEGDYIDVSANDPNGQTDHTSFQDTNTGSDNNANPGESQQVSYITGHSPEALYAAYQSHLGDSNPAAAKALRQMFLDETAFQKQQGTKGGKKAMTTAAAREISDISNAISMLGDLDTGIKDYKSKMGPIKGRWGASNAYDTDSQAFNAQMNIAAQVIGKSFEGGKLADTDILRYRKMLPNITDTPAAAQAKLKIVQKILEGQKSQKEKYYSNTNVMPDLSPYLGDQTDQTDAGQGGGNLGSKPPQLGQKSLGKYPPYLYK